MTTKDKKLKNENHVFFGQTCNLPLLTRKEKYTRPDSNNHPISSTLQKLRYGFRRNPENPQEFPKAEFPKILSSIMIFRTRIRILMKPAPLVCL